MYTKTCNLVEKPGLIWLKQTGDMAIIANGKLYSADEAERFAVVNKSDQWVHSVHESFNAASASMASMSSSF